LTETSELRDFLVGVFKDFVLDEAKNYLSKIDAFRRDLTKDEYRTSEELVQIEAKVKEKAEEMSEDFIDELEVKGISTPEDYEQKTRIIEETLEIYRNKFIKWLSEQMAK